MTASQTRAARLHASVGPDVARDVDEDDQVDLALALLAGAHTFRDLTVAAGRADLRTPAGPPR